MTTLAQFCSRKTSSDSDVHSTSYAQGARETSTAGTVPPVATPRKSRDEVAEGCFISAMTATGRGFMLHPLQGVDVAVSNVAPTTTPQKAELLAG